MASTEMVATTGPRWWQWPTVLSLDAPLVTLLWQWQLARAAGVSIDLARVFVLGVSVWLAYAADRWFEGLRLDPEQVRTQRHLFYQRFRRPVAVLWVALLAADLATALLRLGRAELLAGCLLLTLVLPYLLSHQLIHRNHRLRPPKEACVAVLLGLGAALFVVMAPGANLPSLILPVALFVFLCFANCALIAAWEESVDVSHGQTSLARQFGWAVGFSHAFPWILSAAAVVAAAVTVGAARGAAVCAAASCLLLVFVDRVQPRTGWAMARVLADISLMTPLVPLAASAAHRLW